MAKSRSKAKRRKGTGGTKSVSWGGSYSSRKRRRDYLIGGVLLALAVAGGGYYWWQTAGAERNFLALAAQGQDALASVRSFTAQGRSHLRSDQTHAYGERFPTSGPHALVWTRPGVHDSPQRPTLLVHALEHGNIVIYYDKPGAGVLDTLGAWAALYDGQWDGIVVVPMAGLRDRVVLSAWAKRLDLDPFEPSAAAAFIDAYRGRGPENRVR